MKLLWFVGILWFIFATGEVGAREVKNEASMDENFTSSGEHIVLF